MLIFMFAADPEQVPQYRKVRGGQRAAAEDQADQGRAEHRGQLPDHPRHRTRRAQE